MSDITPDDRERLVDIRFGELFDRHMQAKLPGFFDNRLMEWAELTNQNPQQRPQPQRATYQQPLPSNEPTEKPRRRSAFDIALAQALGLH